MNKVNYSEQYKKTLFSFIKNDNTDKNKTLYELTELKLNLINEQNEINTLKNINDEKASNYSIILSLSLYLIEGNDFIKEKYFNQIENEIFKIFNDFLINPTEEKHKIFLSSFEKLGSNADIIFLICKKLVRNALFIDMAVDLFFRIILEKSFSSLQRSFPFTIKKDQKELMNILFNFSDIKNNYDKVTRDQVMELFRE